MNEESIVRTPRSSRAVALNFRYESDPYATVASLAVELKLLLDPRNCCCWDQIVQKSEWKKEKLNEQ